MCEYEVSSAACAEHRVEVDRGHMKQQWITGIKAMLILVSLLAFSQPGAAFQSPTATEDAEGGNPDYFGALPWELPDDAEKMVVHSVTDGDTVRLTYPNDDWYYNTRIIGIQAPEMDGPWTQEGCYGPEAKEFLKELLPVGADGLFAAGYRRRGCQWPPPAPHLPDRSGTNEAYLVSEILVLGGFADARSYPPNDLYDDILAEAETIARGEDAGLWDACPA